MTITKRNLSLIFLSVLAVEVFHTSYQNNTAPLPKPTNFDHLHSTYRTPENNTKEENYNIFKSKIKDKKSYYPETEQTIDLKLTGIFKSGLKGKSSIILKRQGADEELFREEKNDSNIKIKEIHKKYAVIDNKGKNMILFLNTNKREVEEPSKKNSKTKGSKKTSTPRSALINELSLKPVEEDHDNGYLVSSDPPGRIGKLFGIKKGDIIVSANGYPLGTESSDMLAYHSYSKINRATIVIRRGSSEFSFVYTPLK